MNKDNFMQEELQDSKKIKKVFKELYFEEFNDPSEELTDSLYDLVPPDIIANEIKKIKGVKEKHGYFYMVEKIKVGGGKKNKC